MKILLINVKVSVCVKAVRNLDVFGAVKITCCNGSSASGLQETRCSEWNGMAVGLMSADPPFPPRTAAARPLECSLDNFRKNSPTRRALSLCPPFSVDCLALLPFFMRFLIHVLHNYLYLHPLSYGSSWLRLFHLFLRK